MTLAARTGFELEAAIESYRRTQRTRLAPQTLDRVYVPRLNAFAAWLRAQGMPTAVGSIHREHVESYIEWLQNTAPGARRSKAPGHASATVSIAYRTLRAFFNWAVSEDELNRSPMAKMKPPRVTDKAPEVLTPGEVAKLYKVTSGRTFTDRRDAALLRLLAETGMRRGEVVGLRLADLRLGTMGDRDRRSTPNRRER